MDKSPLVLPSVPGRGLLTLDRKGNLWDTSLSLNFGEVPSKDRLVVIIYPTERGARPLPLAEVKTLRLASRGRQDRSQKPLIRHLFGPLSGSECATLSLCQGVRTVLFLKPPSRLDWQPFELQTRTISLLLRARC